MALEVRIPELPLKTSPKLTDKIALWSSEDNITSSVELSDLRVLILNGEENNYTQVFGGASIIYTVDDAEAGGTIASIPELAGYAFKLRREGYPLKMQSYTTQGDPVLDPSAVEYEILASGGFEIKIPGDKLIKGQRFEIDIIETAPGSGNGGPINLSGSGAFIKGKVEVAANLAYDLDNHLWKLLQVRSGNTQVTITLPDIADARVPDHLFIPIETAFGTTVQTTIETTAGQFIYMNNSSYEKLYMGVGEALWLIRNSDGWYVINDFGVNYRELARPRASYEIGPNEILCNGQELSRAAYARVWEKVQTFGGSLVSDATWLTATATNGAGATIDKPYRGCYSTGDGSTTFRVPDLMNMFLRGVKTDSGTDDERVLNKAGGYQQGMVEEHTHGENVSVDGGSSKGFVGDNNNSTSTTGDNTPLETDPYGGVETRPENVGVLWVINV